jgi:hypothetical protein
MDEILDESHSGSHRSHPIGFAVFFFYFLCSVSVIYKIINIENSISSYIENRKLVNRRHLFLVRILIEKKKQNLLFQVEQNNGGWVVHSQRSIISCAALLLISQDLKKKLKRGIRIESQSSREKKTLNNYS